MMNDSLGIGLFEPELPGAGLGALLGNGYS
jgi:hypothetical protein